MYTLQLILPALAAVRFVSAQYTSTTTFSFTGNALPTGLATYDQVIGHNENVTGARDHEFVPDMVTVGNGYLNLLVPGGQQNDEVIWSAQVQTTFTISAARVDTWAILTDVAGVCNGMFSYFNDNQETDIEWLSDANSQSNVDVGGGRHLFYTNQALVAGTDETTAAGKAPSDATSAVHKYSIEWINGVTTFYLDDKQQTRFTTNVPITTATHWLWNNWSNGDPGWSAGPPATDALFRIQKIVMKYNPGH